jgi:two-component system, NarL family, response regulator NreC
MCPHAQIPEGRTIRCALVHDLLLLRQGLRRLLEDHPDISVVVEAGTSDEALQSIFEHRPEVVIVEQAVFACQPEQAERLILQGSPASKVLFLATHKQEHLRQQGLSNCPIRPTSAEELVAMIRTAAERGVHHSDGTLARVQEMLPRARVLTAREREVLKLLAEGRTVRSVAALLGLSVKTVDAHKFNLMRKLGIHNKAELVMWAIQKKVVKVPVNF